MARTIVWNKRPVRFLLQALKWISADSVLQAKCVEQEILSTINSIPDNPEKYPADRFKRDNAGNFRNLFSYCLQSHQIANQNIAHPAR